MLVVSCCYHKMRFLPCQTKPVNFPLSSTVGLSIANFPTLELKCPVVVKEMFSVYMMRLAAQETVETWLAQTEAEHTQHMNNLGFRACLESAATLLNIKLTKKKRRSLPANVNENIKSYTQAVLGR